MLLLKLRVLSFIATGLICFFALSATGVEGCSSYNDQTIIVPEESTATFQTNITLMFSMRFYKMAPTRHRIFRVDVTDSDNITNTELFFYDRSWENRTHYSGQRQTDDKLKIRIEISNISMKDNGTYRLRSLYGRDFCSTLLVIQKIRLLPGDVIEENEPVYLYVQPHPSLISHPLANATIVWLLDGLFANQTASFIQKDGLIWIPHLTRGLDGKNVTYRTVLDNGDVKEVNHTLNVRYGPSQRLTLIPRQTVYYPESGDIMPDIMCTTDCKPACSISWGKYNSGGTLSLGTVTSKDTGEYTCTATRTGGKTVERSINIHVADNTSFTIAIACLASVQALTTLGLGLCAFLILRRNKQSPCQTCFNNSVRKPPDQNTEDCSKSTAADNHGLEHYEELDTNTRQTNKVYDVPTEVGLERYENTKLSSISTPEVQPQTQLE